MPEEKEEEVIKSAVNQPAEEEMQESLSGPNQDEAPPETPQPGQEQDYSYAGNNQSGYTQEGYQEYPTQEQYAQTDQYSQGLSTDTITEISEQVVSEKFAQIKEDLEKILDVKTTIDSKLEFLDQRLKKIESIIDKLQLSVLQKVGEYVNNVQSLKTEVIETQKSFKSLLDKKVKKNE